MSSYFDCPECNSEKTMCSEKSNEVHTCTKCGFHAGCAFLTGYWKGYEKYKRKIVEIIYSEISLCKPNSGNKDYEKGREIDLIEFSPEE